MDGPYRYALHRYEYASIHLEMGNIDVNSLGHPLCLRTYFKWKLQTK